MMFEFDPQKSDSNKQKHGIDFYEAQALWDDPDLIEIPVKTIDEPRYLVIGTISGKHWSVRSNYVSGRDNKNFLSTAIKERGGRDL